MTKAILQMKGVALFALLGVALVMSFGAVTTNAAASVDVTIIKMIDGTEATPTSAGNESFPMTATWADPLGIGSGTGSFSLTASTDPAYEAVTSQLQPGANYSASEDTNGSVVGADCSAGQSYRLVGYSTGDSRAAALAAPQTLTAPLLTNIQNDKFIMVWNATCLQAPLPVSPANGSTNTTAGQTEVDWTDVTNNVGGITYVYQASNGPAVNPDGSFVSPVYTSGPLATSMIPTPGTPEGTYYWHAMATDANSNTSPWSTAWSFIVDNSTSTPPVATTTQKVYITKYINGVQATALNASSTAFTMNASWDDSQIGSGSGTYALSAPTYQTETVALQDGSDYSTSEVIGTNVGATCAEGLPYALDGYTSGDTMQSAASSTATTTAPSFTNLQSDKYVIVWNRTCANGTIDGNVTTPHGVLAVTSIDAVDTSASADNSYEHGWLYVFHVTLPSNETGLAMKFSDWTSASSTIPVAGNMRISSAQANNGGTKITILAANVYTIPNLQMTTDLNPSMPGIQVEVSVEVKIPVGTPDASYTTNYGVRSQ